MKAQYHVIIKRRAEKEMSKLDRQTQLLIAKWILDNLEGCENPKTVGDGKKLESVKNGWRWRLGAYRILGTINKRTITIEIFRIRKRGEAYCNL